MAEQGFSTIKYFVKRNIDLEKYASVDVDARQNIETARDDDVLAVKISVNSPAKIVKALPLTQQNLRLIVGE